MSVTIRLGRGRGSEITTFQDTGCFASPSCLDCSLPVCVHDGGGAYLQGLRMDGRAAAAGRLVAVEGRRVEEAAERLGVTARTVYRYLARWRGSGRAEGVEVGVWTRCEHCEAEIYQPPRKRKRRYCGQLCQSKARRAEKAGGLGIEAPSP